MSTTRRRAVGALAAILLLAASLAYSGWRLHVIGQEGWAGLSYIPATPQAKKAEMPRFPEVDGARLRRRSGDPVPRRDRPDHSGHAPPRRARGHLRTAVRRDDIGTHV